jgi:uncharacterized lipoprotein YbaY
MSPPRLGDEPSWDGSGSEAIVTGAIRFPDEAPAFAGATVHVSLLEVTRSDAPARVIVVETIAGASHTGSSGGSLAFTLRAKAIEVRDRYVVRVHVDVDNDGRVSPGDFISTSSYPVLTLGHANHVIVQVHRVVPRAAGGE